MKGNPVCMRSQSVLIAHGQIYKLDKVT